MATQWPSLLASSSTADSKVAELQLPEILHIVFGSPLVTPYAADTRTLFSLLPLRFSTYSFHTHITVHYITLHVPLQEGDP